MSEKAPNQTTIEVTDEMIEVGMRAQICHCGASIHRDEVIQIYSAMERARRAALATAGEAGWTLTQHGYEGPLE